MPEFWQEAHEGTWHSLSLLLGSPNSLSQTYLMSCIVLSTTINVSHNWCQTCLFQSVKADSSVKNFLLAGSPLSYLKLHTRCQCKQKLNMRCSPSLASAPSTFLSEFFLMIIFMYGTALNHSTKTQTQTQTLLWVPCATGTDRHSWLSFSNVWQAGCLTYSSVYGETLFLCVCVISEISSFRQCTYLRTTNWLLMWTTDPAQVTSCPRALAPLPDEGWQSFPTQATMAALLLQIALWGLEPAQELKELGSDMAVTHSLQSTEENLGFTWWTRHEKMNDTIIIIIITLSFSWNNSEWKCLWFLWSRWITIMSVYTSYIQSMPADKRAWYRDT